MHRVEVRLKSHLPDARGQGLVRDIYDLGITTVSEVRVAEVYWLDADLTPAELDLICGHLLADPVIQDYFHTQSFQTKGEVGADFHNVEVAYNAGVTDPVEDSVMKAIRDLGISGVRRVKTSKYYLIKGRLDDNQLETICGKLLLNPIIQHVVEQEESVSPEKLKYNFRLEQVDILVADKVKGFGFTDDELRAIITYFRKQGRNPTDVELETLAQTWSEHCGHKTFRGKVRFGGKTINNLLKSTIIKATEELGKPWCLSVFVDNAGVIDFDGRWALCFKVETHNHPSAVEPYGGAATGIGGVVRDPLGTGLGAKPILNTDVFCFGPLIFRMKSCPVEFCIRVAFLKEFGLGWLTMLTVWGYLPLMVPYSLMKGMWLTPLSTVGHWDCCQRTWLREVNRRLAT